MTSAQALDQQCPTYSQEQALAFSIIDQLTQGVFICEDDLSIYYANPAAAALWSRDSQEVIGLDCTTFMHSLDAPTYVGALEKARSQASPTQVQIHRSAYHLCHPATWPDEAAI